MLNKMSMLLAATAAVALSAGAAIAQPYGRDNGPNMSVTVGDPASELAKIIDTADEVQRQSAQMIAQNIPRSSGQSMSGFEGPEGSEHTIIRIRTADDFAMRDKDGASVAKARMVIDRFEEEETRQAQLSGDQLKVLRGGRRDSAEIERSGSAGPRSAAQCLNSALKSEVHWP